MKTKEFLRKLKKEGCVITQSTRHIKISYEGNTSFFPGNHVSRDIHRGLANQVLKQLELDKGAIL